MSLTPRDLMGPESGKLFDSTGAVFDLTAFLTILQNSGVSISGNTVVISATVSRPNDALQYAAGDQVTSDPADAITFSGMGRSVGGSGYVIQAICIDSAAQATKPNLRLYLFSDAPTPNNDNEAWAPSDADMLNLIGYVEFSSWEVGNSTVGAGGNCASIVENLTIPFECGLASDEIYGLLVERGTYTPVAQEVFKVVLGVLQD